MHVLVELLSEYLDPAKKNESCRLVIEGEQEEILMEVTGKKMKISVTSRNVPKVKEFVNSLYCLTNEIKKFPAPPVAIYDSLYDKGCVDMILDTQWFEIEAG